MFKENSYCPIFSEDWYLDIVCRRGNWETLEAFDKGNNTTAVLPIFRKEKLGIKYTTMPLFTPYLGFMIDCPPDLTVSKRLSFEEKVLDQIIYQLGDYPIISFTCHPKVKNVFPFIKKGFHACARATYIIPVEREIAGYQSEMSQKLRKEIERTNIDIKEVEEVNEFLQMLTTNFSTKGISNYLSPALFHELDHEIRKRGQRKLYTAWNGKSLLGGAYTVHDANYTYLLHTALNKKTTVNGVIAKLIDHAIKESLTAGRNFDFEGSQIPGVEQFFRKFGGVSKPYFVLSKEKSRFWKLLKLMKK